MADTVDQWSAAGQENIFGNQVKVVRTRSLTGQEIDELDRLYRSAATDLARVRTNSPDPDVIAELSRILSAARGRLAGTGGVSGTVIARFFKVSLPYALYQIRWVTVGVMLVFIAIGVLEAHYLITTPEAMNQLGTPEQLRRYAHSDFVEYYHQDTNAEFQIGTYRKNSSVSRKQNKRKLYCCLLYTSRCV